MDFNLEDETKNTREANLIRTIQIVFFWYFCNVTVILSKADVSDLYLTTPSPH